MRGIRPVPRRVFVDTSFYVAFAYPGDAYHHAAVAIARDLATSRAGLITTNVVAIETHILVLARAGRDAALRALRLIYATRESLNRISEADELRAMAILEQYDDKDYSFADATSFAVMERLGIATADATSFAVMERLGIATAVAFDRHFAQFGWHVFGAE